MKKRILRFLMLYVFLLVWTEYRNMLIQYTTEQNSQTADQTYDQTFDQTTRQTEVELSDLFEYQEVDGGIMITEYNGYKEYESVIIPDEIDGKKVIAIGSMDRAWNPFWTDTVLKEVTIPDSVESIGQEAFESCTNLEVVNMGKSVKEVGEKAFKSCNLKEIVFYDGLEIIGGKAFLDNMSLERVTIPDSCMVIGENNFLDTDTVIVTTKGSAAEIYVEDNQGDSAGKLSVEYN